MSKTSDLQPTSQKVLARLLGLLRFLLIAEIVGVGAELLLIAHWDDAWQWAPLIVLGAGLVVCLGHIVVGNWASRRAVQLVMVLFVLSGLLGSWLHYDGRVEFRREIDPSLSGWGLFRSAMTGSSTPPVLAPGIMIQMGLLGLAAVCCRPADGEHGEA